MLYGLNFVPCGSQIGGFPHIRVLLRQLCSALFLPAALASAFATLKLMTWVTE
jgi:hypothetical protein